MSHLAWIHCNLCYYLFSKQQRKIYHLTCFHLLCRNCMVKTDSGTVCPVCKRSITNYVEIGKTMDKEVKSLYEPNVSTRLLDHAARTINFQQKQREHLIDRILFCRQQLPKMDEMEQVLQGKVLEMQRRYEKLRNYRRSLQNSLRQADIAVPTVPPYNDASASNAKSFTVPQEPQTQRKRNDHPR